MKKVLLGTSAIALASAFASPAAASDWTVRVGGYMEQYVAYVDNDASFDGDFDGIDSKQDAEVWFLPSITLDNGIKFGANIQLEAFQNGDQIDESYMFISGSFGEILLGSENSAGYKMTYAAPDVTMLNVNSGSLGSFVPFSSSGGGDDVFRATLGTTFLENEGNNDAQRFTYFTPRFAGFQVGASYARDGSQDTNEQEDTDGSLHDIIDIGANYVNSFGGFDVAVSGRWGTASQDGSDPTVWSAGINLGFAGFTIGGSYAEQNKAETENGKAYDIGVSYETGPWGFSFTYFKGENAGDGDGTMDVTLDDVVFNGGTDDLVIPGDFTAETGDDELEAFLLGARYKLAKGVALHAFGAYVDFEDAGGGNSVDDVDGFIIGTGVKINF